MDRSTHSITLTGGTKKQLKLEFSELKKVATLLRIINHPLRRKILQVLIEDPNLNVTELYVKLRIEQSVVSQHLAMLRNANVIVSKRTGKFVTYTTNEQRLQEINVILLDIAR